MGWSAVNSWIKDCGMDGLWMSQQMEMRGSKEPNDTQTLQKPEASMVVFQKAHLQPRAMSLFHGLQGGLTCEGVSQKSLVLFQLCQFAQPQPPDPREGGHDSLLSVWGSPAPAPGGRAQVLKTEPTNQMLPRGTKSVLRWLRLPKRMVIHLVPISAYYDYKIWSYLVLSKCNNMVSVTEKERERERNHMW